MGLDFLENNSSSLAESVISNAKEDAKDTIKEKASESFNFNTKSDDFGKENDTERESSEESKESDSKNHSSGSTASFDDEEPKDSIDDSGLSDKEKRRNQLTCELYVYLMSLGTEITAKILSGEYDSNSFEIKKNKQKEIAALWAEVLNEEGKVKSPRSALNGILVGATLPILVSALQIALNKRRAKKEQKKRPFEGFKGTENKTEEKAPESEFTNQGGTKKGFSGNQIEDAEIISETYEKGEKGTAEIKKDPENEKTDSKPQEKTERRGRIKGKRKNPNTEKYEYPTKLINKANGLPYLVYSWGEQKVIPPKDRNNLDQFKIVSQ